MRKVQKYWAQGSKKSVRNLFAFSFDALVKKLSGRRLAETKIRLKK